MAAARKIDFEQLAQDFRGLDPNDPGAWPLAPRVAVFIGLFIAVVALSWWFVWKDQVELLETRVAEEAQLRQDWVGKKRLALNLEAYKRQLGEADRQFGALLKQLPNKAEMDSLLSDINQAGLGRGLHFDLFKPGSEAVKDFYAEMPIAIRIVGSYHDLGRFASDVARMPRIVTLSDMDLKTQEEGLLVMEASAITYRYLDDEEQSQQRRAAAGKGK
ncbi:MAG: type 4a pilus biogenesis protein PilO [Rhodocyclaceae bacterium]|nr:type 4a pilus biogenesis protein PilO [Rhodocyclaceae bacterium]